VDRDSFFGVLDYPGSSDQDPSRREKKKVNQNGEREGEGGMTNLAAHAVDLLEKIGPNTTPSFGIPMDSPASTLTPCFGLRDAQMFGRDGKFFFLF
jgi:hypothetical protein